MGRHRREYGCDQRPGLCPPPWVGHRGGSQARLGQSRFHIAQPPRRRHFAGGRRNAEVARSVCEGQSAALREAMAVASRAMEVLVRGSRDREFSCHGDRRSCEHKVSRLPSPKGIRGTIPARYREDSQRWRGQPPWPPLRWLQLQPPACLAEIAACLGPRSPEPDVYDKQSPRPPPPCPPAWARFSLSRAPLSGACVHSGTIGLRVGWTTP